MSIAYNCMRRLTPLARHFNSPDYYEAISILKEYLPFREHVFKTDDQINGWIIPPKWQPAKATIKTLKGDLVYDGMNHPLGLVSYSTSFKGRVSLNQLKRHLFFHKSMDEAIPFHFRYSYRPWTRDWGFCLPKSLYDTLTHEYYDINIEIIEDVPELTVLDYSINPDSDVEFVFAAHLDHPGMSDDGLSGCAVGVELFNNLSHRSLKYGYRLILVQEIIGSQFYLSRYGRGNIKEGIFLEMLSNDQDLSFQFSNNGNTTLEYAFKNVIENENISCNYASFRQLAKNDEIVFESFGIPMSSIQRFPYIEYHTNFDNMNLVNSNRINEAIDILEKIVIQLEKDYFIKPLYNGLVCLANPSTNLYIEPGQVVFEEKNVSKYHDLMEKMFLLNDGAFVSKISRDLGIPVTDILDYLVLWENKGLIKNNLNIFHYILVL